MKYALQYELTAEDFIDFQLYYNRTSKTIQHSVLKTRVLMVGIYTMGAVYFIFSFKGVSLIIGLGVLFLLASVQLYLLPRRQEMKVKKLVKKMIADDNANKTLGNKKLALEDNTLVYEEELGVYKIDAGQISKIEETERSFFLFKDEISALIVPKRAFQSPEEGVRFTQEILNNRQAQA